VGVDTARILDIIYPARDVLGLLVHVQYLPLITETLKKQKITPLTNFDPVDSKHIAVGDHLKTGPLHSVHFVLLRLTLDSLASLTRIIAHMFIASLFTFTQ
jgi:hypothetical protein